MSELRIEDGERLVARTAETVAAYNAFVGADVLTFHCLRHALTYGTKVRSGRRIRIPSVRFGRKIYTSLEAISRWARAVSEAALDEAPPERATTMATAAATVTPRRRAEAAERLLDAELR